MSRLLITGTREGWDEVVLEGILYKQRAALLQGEVPVTLVHGGARGVDRQAAAIWSSFGEPVEEHPARWDLHGRQAGPMRNQEMVNAGADRCVAFILLGSSRGTTDCMERARMAKIPVYSYTREARS